MSKLRKGRLNVKKSRSRVSVTGQYRSVRTSTTSSSLAHATRLTQSRSRRSALDHDNEWTEEETLRYLDDLIERNAEALDGLSKL
jgi:hypothetical protein